MRRFIPYFSLFCTLLLLVSCGGGGGAAPGGGGGGGGGGGITVTVLPSSGAIQIDASVQFTTIVSGTANTAVTWSVDGGAANGTVTITGLYTAPSFAGSYTVRAVSDADGTTFDTAIVTVSSGAVSLDSFLYIANRGIAPEWNQEIGIFEMMNTGSLSLVDYASAESLTAGVTVSSDGNYLYASHVLSSTIEQFRINTGGSLTPLSPATIVAGGDAWDIKAHPSRDAVYVVDATNNRLYQFAISGSGTLTTLGSGPLNVGNNPKNIGFSADGNTLYLTHSGDGTVRQFTIAVDGSLTVHSTASVAADVGAWGITISPNGVYAYVACSTSGTICQYSIAGNGSLVPLGTPRTVTAVINRAAMISTNGSYFYTADYGDGAGSGTATILQYSINGNGTLTQLSPFTVSAGDAPMPIFVAPGTDLAYVANQGSNTVGIYRVGASGQLSIIENKVTGEPGAGPAAFAFVQQ